VLARLKDAQGGAKPAAGASAGGIAAGAGPAGVPLAELAKYIDHTLLKPESTQAQVDKLCDEAIQYKFYSVCVNSTWVARCARRLRVRQATAA
ncbi:MAG TPA: hypothetical protein PLN91_12400, partial [Rhodanobacteraceae bacterium]|nr:hypothetical protein [Rhodanobacteraceae bacterium]